MVSRNLERQSGQSKKQGFLYLELIQIWNLEVTGYKRFGSHTRCTIEKWVVDLQTSDNTQTRTKALLIA